MNSYHKRNIAITQLLLFLFLIAQLSTNYQKISAVAESDVDSVQIVASNPEVKGSIETMISSILLNNPNYLSGVTTIVVSEHDLDFLAEGNVPCGGHLLGAIGNGTIIIKESGFETNKKTLYHEIGHNIWNNLDETQRQSWPFEGPFVTFYASTSQKEDFAESFSCLMTNFNGCMASLSLEKKSFIETV